MDRNALQTLEYMRIMFSGGRTIVTGIFQLVRHSIQDSHRTRKPFPKAVPTRAMPYWNCPARHWPILIGRNIRTLQFRSFEGLTRPVPHVVPPSPLGPVRQDPSRHSSPSQWGLNCDEPNDAVVHIGSTTFNAVSSLSCRSSSRRRE